MASQKNKWHSSPRKAPDSFPAEKGFPRGEGRIYSKRKSKGDLKKIHARKARRWRRADAIHRLEEELAPDLVLSDYGEWLDDQEQRTTAHLGAALRGYEAEADSFWQTLTSVIGPPFSDSWW